MPFFILGIGFLIVGLLQAIHPISFHSGGGYTGRGAGGSFAYNANQSQGFGVFFALIGFIFLYWGYCVVRNAKKIPPSSTDH